MCFSTLCSSSLLRFVLVYRLCGACADVAAAALGVCATSQPCLSRGHCRAWGQEPLGDFQFASWERPSESVLVSHRSHDSPPGCSGCSKAPKIDEAGRFRFSPGRGVPSIIYEAIGNASSLVDSHLETVEVWGMSTRSGWFRVKRYQKVLFNCQC